MLREQYTNGTKFFCRNFSYVYILRLNDEGIQLVQETGRGDSVDHYSLSYCSLCQLHTGEPSNTVKGVYLLSPEWSFVGFFGMRN